MKLAAIMTEDFRLMHGLMREMSRLGLRYTVLAPGEYVPPYVGLVITSEKEVEGIDFERKIGVQNPELGAAEAMVYLSGTETCERMFIGIDPGKRPGLAVICDGSIVEKVQARNPEDCRRIASEVLGLRRCENAVIRIGDGDLTNRNRIIAAMMGLGVSLELVDEKNTTRFTKNSDIEAAIRIAFTAGKEIEGTYEIKPSDGEIRDIQRRSRIESRGALTIGKELADRVARGNMTMERAIDEQRRRNEKKSA